jgi:hypothetical protein
MILSRRQPPWFNQMKRLLKFIRTNSAETEFVGSACDKMRLRYNIAAGVCVLTLSLCVFHAAK